MTTRDFAVLATLCNLRWVAVLCQAGVLVAAGAMGIALPALPMWVGIAALAAFNVYALLRSRRATPVLSAEVFLHIAADVTVLAWLISWSGGIANPFTSLFLLPIAFAALALPPRWIYATAAICGLGYAAAALFGKPFPHLHGAINDIFDVHLAGMVVNFVLSVGVVLYFLARLATTLRERDDELARLRERFARNEGIVALGTHAASVAHELNTPLGTLTLMLDELLDQSPPESIRSDLQSMRAVVDDCRDRVRELAAPASRAGDTDDATLVDLHRVVDRWLLTRPTVELVRVPTHAPLPRVEPAVGHLLQALLNNAADASEAAGSPRVELTLACADGLLKGDVRDHGAGIAEARAFLPGRMFNSGKPGGLGVGLALGHATVERFDGELSMQPAAGGGLRIEFRLPLGWRQT